MKAARLVTTNPGNGNNTKSDDVALIVNVFEAQILYRALDQYCEAHPGSRDAKLMYHAFGWNYRDYLPPSERPGDPKRIAPPVPDFLPEDVHQIPSDPDIIMAGIEALRPDMPAINDAITVIRIYNAMRKAMLEAAQQGVES